MERNAYTITNLDIGDDGTIKVSISYIINEQNFTNEVPVFFSIPANLINDPIELKKTVLEYVDFSIQNRINTHKDKIDRKLFADNIKNQYSNLIGVKVDLTQEEFKTKINELSQNS